jgi:hypothetical protein
MIRPALGASVVAAGLRGRPGPRTAPQYSRRTQLATTAILNVEALIAEWTLPQAPYPLRWVECHAHAEATVSSNPDLASQPRTSLASVIAARDCIGAAGSRRV